MNNKAKIFLRQLTKEIDIPTSNINSIILLSFKDGFSAHKKEIEKVLLDELNKYRSQHSEETQSKLGRGNPNFKRETELLAKIELLKYLSDEVIYVSKDEYKSYLIQKRNEWMCDNSAFVIAVWDGLDGGTGNCVKYAREWSEERRFAEELERIKKPVN